MLLILAVFVGLIGPVLNIFVNCFITCKIEVCKFSMIMCGFILKHFKNILTYFLQEEKRRKLAEAAERRQKEVRVKVK